MTTSHTTPRGRSILGWVLVGGIVAIALSTAVRIRRSQPPDLPKTPADHPTHLLIVVFDALRADALSIHGNSQTTNPWLEHFAEHAVVFERTRAQGTYTQASFWSYMTSSHVRTTGWDFHVPGPLPTGGFCGRTDLQTLAEVLTTQGFSNSAISANAFLYPNMGFPRGFHVWNTQEVARLESGEISDKDRDGVSLAPWLLREISGWDDGQRHFLYLHAMHPHLPSKPGEKARERFGLPEKEIIRVDDARRLERKGTPEQRQQARDFYHAEVWEAGQALRRVINALERKDLLDDTLVVVTADHGERLFEHDDLYGHSRGVWQELSWVPLLMHAPNLTPARVDNPAALVDLAPTLLHLLGLERAVPATWQGENLLDPTRWESPRTIVTERLDEVAVTIDGRLEAIRDDHLQWRLYDLQDDPGEQAPLDNPEKLDELLAAFEAWERSTPVGTIDQEAEPVGLCRDLEEEEQEELTETLRVLGYVE